MTPVARRVAAIALALAALTACADAQDPGLAPSGDEPATTSNTLGQCPAGGPDATTPAAGCIGDDGQVLRG
ncbi:hypothetical protein [Actinospongicola halichondriae]|uniref:hypothetical protein n=1 Tax=Actinospongicola halichondriae TaxID=3236844 RepID=UPI003D4DA0C1